MSAAELQEFYDRQNQFSLATRAFGQGDYAGARDGLLKLEASGGVRVLCALWLARSYARLNDDANTYKQLHILLYPPKPDGANSLRESPVILVYYGDLCERLHHPDEAATTYYTICHDHATDHEDPLRSMLLALGPDDSTRLLRSSALAVAAYNLGSHLLLARRYCEAAVALVPNSAIARIAYADFLHRKVAYGWKQSPDQYWKAQQVADEQFVPLIEAYRKTLHVDGQNSVFELTRDGKMIHHVEQYRPKGPVVTPAVADFKTDLPED